jgi:uncharacterized membrane protein YbhN (UPF0104 family)
MTTIAPLSAGTPLQTAATDPRPAWRGLADIARSRATATILWLALGAGVLVFVLPQAELLADAVEHISAGEPVWLITAGLLVVARYILSAASLRLALGRPLPLGPAILVQVSSSFVGRLPPEGLGWLLLNQRFLERSGIPRSLAATAIGTKVLAGALSRAVVMAAVALALGSRAGLAISIDVPWPAVGAGGAGVLALLFVLRSRVSMAASRILVPAAAAVRQLAALSRDPARAAALLLASAGLPLSYSLALAATVLAFGGSVPVADVIAVYLAGTAVASLSPTPGNLGAIELALTAGLSAVGVPAPEALAAVLVFRLLTFWLPLLPGFVAFRYLQHDGRI